MLSAKPRPMLNTIPRSTTWAVGLVSLTSLKAKRSLTWWLSLHFSSPSKRRALKILRPASSSSRHFYLLIMVVQRRASEFMWSCDDDYVGRLVIDYRFLKFDGFCPALPSVDYKLRTSRMQMAPCNWIWFQCLTLVRVKCTYDTD